MEYNNPALRGWPLILAAKLVNYSSFLAKATWHNANFDCANNIEELHKRNWHLQPIVTPLAPDGVVQTQAEITPELYERQPEDLTGRFYSAADYHELFKAGKLTPLQVAKALLPLLSREQSSSEKYAVACTVTREDLVLAAATKSTERYAAGQPLGILDGVPIGVKDDQDVEGYVTHIGLPYNAADPFFKPATETVWPVAQLEAAGAIVIGKLTMQELGSDISGCNPSWGSPVNWNNPAYYPGGSSSGAGSAICAGLIPIAIGTDAGGSIRVPSSYCGSYGLKPTLHRAVTMKSAVCVVGPMAATANDLAITYRIMTTPNPEDPVQGSFALSVPPSPTAKKTIGIYWDWFNAASPAVVKVTKNAVSYFENKLGYEVVDISIPYLQEGQGSLSVWALIEGIDHCQGRAMDRNKPFANVNYCNQLLFGFASQTPAADMFKHGQLRGLLMEHLAFLWKQHPGMLILTPTTPDAGWKIHPGDQAYGFSDGSMTIRNMMYSWLANTTGCPAASAPVGYVDPEVGEGKLPVGLMAMGEWGSDEQLLAWTKEAEAYLNDAWDGGRSRPKKWVDVVDISKDVE